MLADRHTAALVSRAGSLEWLCLLRFDSEAVFAALLGDESNGHWTMAPVDGEVVRREYLTDTFVLVTRWQTPTGEAVVTEFMPQGQERADVIRHVECVHGELTMRHELVMRFRYGRSKPWVRRIEAHGEEMLTSISGPNALAVHGPLLHADGDRHVGAFPIAAGETLCWSLTWHRSFDEPPPAQDTCAQLDATVRDWRRWAADIIAEGHPEPTAAPCSSSVP